MSTIEEIQAAAEKLPPTQVDELSRWLETLRQKRARQAVIDSWLERAKGAAIPGISTDEVMALTRF